MLCCGPACTTFDRFEFDVKYTNNSMEYIHAGQDIMYIQEERKSLELQGKQCPGCLSAVFVAL